MSFWIKSTRLLAAIALGLTATAAAALPLKQRVILLPAKSNTNVVVHDHEGTPIADVTITGDAAKTLYDFLTDGQEATETRSGVTVTTRVGYNISCSKLDQPTASGTATTYRCDQRLTKDGTATAGQIDPIIGGGN